MTKRQMILVVFLGTLLIGPVMFVTGGSSDAQVAQNPQNDLWGSNLGDSIMFKWSTQPGASEYIVYRGTSVNGPWTELFRDIDINVGGMREDITPDAKIMDLCYKVEAIDGADQVIRIYQPMCVPKFVG